MILPILDSQMEMLLKMTNEIILKIKQQITINNECM